MDRTTEYCCRTYRNVTSVDVVRLWITFYFLQNNARMIICHKKEPVLSIYRDEFVTVESLSSINTRTQTNSHAVTTSNL